MKRNRARIWIDLNAAEWSLDNEHWEDLDTDTCENISEELGIYGTHQFKLSTNINRYNNKLEDLEYAESSNGVRYTLNGTNSIWFCTEGLMSFLGHIPEEMSFELVK